MGKFGIVGDAIGAVEDAVGSAKEFSDDFTSSALFAAVQNPIDNFTHIFNRVSPVDLPHVQLFERPDDNNSVGTKAGTVAGRTFSAVLTVGAIGAAGAGLEIAGAAARQTEKNVDGATADKSPGEFARALMVGGIAGSLMREKLKKSQEQEQPSE